MVGKSKKRLIPFFAALLLFCVGVSAQDGKGEQADSLVRLLNGKSLELIEKYGINYRKAVEATFLHNGTYLICDTALWNVEAKTINCQGNVRLMQDETILTSDTLDYLIDEDLAKFRGSIVQLTNKENNVLRTRNLDYNTKDSLAVFRAGASMRDSDGQIVESDEGTYESARKLFTFRGDVNLFTDSVFVKTTLLTYNSSSSMIDFLDPVDFWKEENMLSAGCGWYDRLEETFFFKDDVHGLTKDRETWSDTLYFYRNTGNVLMEGNVQVQDSTRNMATLSQYTFYEDSLKRVTLRKDAAIALETKSEDKLDTLYMGADEIIYTSVKMCDIPDGEKAFAATRSEDMNADPVNEYRKRAAQEAAAAAKAALEAAREEDANLANKQIAEEKAKAAAAAAKAAEEKAKSASAKPSSEADAPASVEAQQDSLLTNPSDTLSVPMDSLSVAADTIAVEPPKDSTAVGFITALGNVRSFRKDMQVRCDSLLYSDLDSIARFYRDPVIWNDTTRQYTSDSLFVLVRDGRVDRASLMSNAFIITKESDEYFDQIRGTDVLAFFDSTSALRRFDALGGATALFYLKEKEEKIATVNKVETKMLSALLKDGQLERVFYFEAPKNDAFPVVQLPSKDHRLKGFDWRPDERPTCKDDITPLSVIPSQRTSYESRPHADFVQTEIYFPGYMTRVRKDIAASRARKDAARRARKAAEDSLSRLKNEADTLGHALIGTDSLSVASADSLLNSADSLSRSDSLSVADSLSTGNSGPLSEKELREQQRKERAEARETARKMRIARRDARWAELDRRDAEKAAARAQRKLDRKRAITKKEYLRQREQDRKDALKLQKNIERFQKQKERHERKQQHQPS